MPDFELFAVFFLSPWTALATAAGAASIPVIIHLLNRKRYRVVPWAAMRFLLNAQRRTVRKLRIEQWLLLALRIALILLLILAMIAVTPWLEPLWSRLFPGDVGPAAAHAGRTHRVIVIDGSFSMGRKHADGTSFDRAKQVAQQIVNNASPGDGFSLFLASAPSQAIVPGPSDNAGNVLEEIEQLRLPHGNSDLAGTLTSVERISAKPLGKYQQREIYLLTDLQQTLFQGHGLMPVQVSEPSDADIWQRLQSRASVIFVDVARESSDNVAVVHMALGEPLALTNALNSVTALVHNYGSTDRLQMRVDLLIGKGKYVPGDAKPDAEAVTSLRLVQQQLVNVPAGAAVPVTFPLQFAKAGEYVVQIKIENDALELDDSRSLIATVKNVVPVVLVNGKPAAERDQQATHHLATALNPQPKTSSATASPFATTILTEAQFADVSLGDLEPYDCVFLCDIARMNERKIERIETFLKRGGGVVFTLGNEVDLESYNRLLYKNGEGILPARLLGVERAKPDQVFTLAGDDQAFQLPPLAAFADDNDRATLLAARFRQYVKVVLPAKTTVRKLLSFLPPGGASPRGELDPAVLEWQRHRGRVFLITTTVSLDWGSWPGSPAFLPFVHELARHAALGAPPRVVTANEPLQEYLPARFAGLDATIHAPDGRTSTVPVQEHEDVSVLRFPDTSASGVYRLALTADREHLFAVNVPAATTSALASESDLRRVDPGEFQSSDEDGIQVVTDLGQVEVRRRVVVSTDETEATSKSTAGPAVARVLLFIFLALLVLEMILAWRFGSARTVALPDAAAPPAHVPRWRRFLSPSNLAYMPLVPLFAFALVLIHELVTGEFLGFLPAAIRSVIEQVLGVPEAAPGEGTRWKLEYLAYVTGDGNADRWLAGALLIALIAAAAVIYRMERIAARIRVPGEPPRSGRSLVGLTILRGALLATTLIVLLPQLQLYFEREGWPDVVLMYDTSRSFSAVDDFQDADADARAKKLQSVWAKLSADQMATIHQRIAEFSRMKNGESQAERLAAVDQELADLQAQLADLKGRSRLNLAKALTASEDDWLTSLLQQRQVKVHVYRCDTKAAKIDEVVDVSQVAAVLKKVRELRPTGDSSQLGSGVRTVLNDFRGASLGAVIFVTDGVVTDGEDLVQAARAAARADVPLFLVGIGDAHEPRDLILHDLQVEDVVNVRDRLIFEVRVSKKGKLDVTHAPVVLSEKKPNGELVEIKREVVALDGTRPVKVRLNTTPTEAGEKTYVITVPNVEKEVDTANNRLERRIQVADARPVRVLYIEGFPHHDYRFIKTLLEREAGSQRGNRSMIVKVLLADADKDFAQQDKSAVAEFPSREELFAFDAVILGDVDPKHAKLGERNMQLLRDFVRERGGGMLFLAGIHGSMPNAYRDTPLADVLPVVPSDDELPEEKTILTNDLRDGYRPVLTPVGQQHPIFRFVTDDAQNAEIWQSLPTMFFSAGRYRMKPGAEVLATHPMLPARRTVGGESSTDLHPLAVQQFVGAGRVLFLGFNETSRWRYRELELRFNQFWIQTVRYLARSRIGRIDLHLDKQTPYRRNEPIRVTVRFPDDSAPPADDVQVKVLVERNKLRNPGETTSQPLDTQTLQLTKVKGSRATYEALLVRTPEGEYKFWLAAPLVSGHKPEAGNRVLPPPGELDRLRLDQSVLEQAAKESRGKFYTLADVESLIDELPSGTRIALNQPRPPWLMWNHAVMFLLALSVLTSEWILRKRNRLL